MAYVAISNQLREDVSRVIRDKHRAEWHLVPKPAAPIIAHDDVRIVEKFWGEHINLRELIPLNWCTKVDSLQINTEYLTEPGNQASSRTMQVTPTIVGGQVLAPPKVDTYYPRIHVPCDDPLVAEHVALAILERQVGEKWNKIRNDVDRFLTNSKSLNEALKLWPDLRIYIPETYIQRMGVKYEKQAKAESRAMEILKQIDTDAAVASAVTLRIMQATQQETT